MYLETCSLQCNYLLKDCQEANSTCKKKEVKKKVILMSRVHVQLDE